jgi:AbrB family looped-hinge helix DNA binding protein
MKLIKISCKFQVTIPKGIRVAMALKAGEELQVYVHDSVIYLRRRQPIKNLRGIAKGMKWDDSYRDRNDRY